MREKIKQYLIQLFIRNGIIECQLCGDHTDAKDIQLTGKINDPKTFEDYILVCPDCKKEVGAGGFKLAELKADLENYPHQGTIVTYSKRYKLAVKFGVMPDITELHNKVKFHFEK